MRGVGCELLGVGVWGRCLRVWGWGCRGVGEWGFVVVEGSGVGWWLRECRGLRQGTDIRIDTSPVPLRSNVTCLTCVLNFIVIILKIPSFYF